MSEPIVWLLESDQAKWFDFAEPFDIPDDIKVTPLVPQPGSRRFDDADHVVLNGQTNECVCEHCGQRYKVNMPVPMSIMTAIIDAFLDIHHKCEKRSET